MLAHHKFPDLLAVVSALRRNVLLENCRQLLINPCPRLPLNAIFSGYADEAAERRRNRGRGGRGRGGRGRGGRGRGGRGRGGRGEVAKGEVDR